MRANGFWMTVIVMALLAVGCGGEESAPPATDGSQNHKETAKHPLESFVLSAEPTDVMGVKDAIVAKKFDQDVIVVGKIGEMVNGIAAFQLVDFSQKDCLECGDGCPTPWDFC